MNKVKIFLIIIYTFIIIISLCGCSNTESNKNVEEKINSEIQYLDKEIIGIMNKLNNITLENYEVKSKKSNTQSKENGESGDKSSSNGSSQGDNSNKNGDSGEQKGSGNNQDSTSIKVMQMQPSNILVIDKNDIDWMTIKSEIEVMYTSWNSILVDLYSININNSDILDFGKTLDSTILNAKSENKANTLLTLANLYAYLPKYIDKLSMEESQKNIIRTKSYLVNAYALVEQDNWVEVQNQLNKADEIYAKVTNDVKYLEKKQEETTRIYVLIKELKNSVNLQDKDIFYIKYKNLLNSM